MVRVESQRHWARLAILAVVLVWFSPWWAGGKVLAPLDLLNRMMSPWHQAGATEFAKNHVVSDGVSQYLVYRLIAQRDLDREGAIGWSSLTYGGTAEYANTMASYGDWTMQLHRWLDFWTAWHVGIVGQVLVAAFGMLSFLRGRGIGWSWAACGALLYAANSQFITWLYHRWAMGSFCWVPWILWAIDQYRAGNRRAWPLVPAFIAMAFLGGTLQHCALVVVAVAVMWLDEALTHKAETAGQGMKSGIVGQAPLLTRYAIWGVLGAGLASFMLIPCTDAFLTSNRLGLHTGMTANAADSVYRYGWLQPILHLGAIPLQWFPSILGRCGSLDVLKLFKSELFYIAFFGSLPVIVALVRGWRRSSPRFCRLMILAGLILPLTPLVRFLYQRLYLLFIIGGILAFVHFLQHVGLETRMRWAKRLGASLTLITIAWTAVSLILLTQQALLDSLKQRIVSMVAGSSFGYFSDWLDLRATRFIGDLFVWSPQQLWPLLLLALIVSGLWLTTSSAHGLSRLGHWLIIVGVIAEVSLFGARWLVWSDPAKDPLFAETPESRILKTTVGRDGRVTTLMHPTGHMAMTPFVPNTLAAYDIPTIHGYDSIVPDGMLLPNESPGDAAKLGRFGVTHLVTYGGNPDVPSDWRPIWKSRAMDLYGNPLACPRYAGFADEASLQRFFTSTGEPAVPLDEECGLQNTRRIHIPAGLSWIRIAENQADGWQWQISGQAHWNDVIRAQDKSMVLNVGHSNTPRIVDMRYQPPMRTIGTIVSAASLLVVIITGLRCGRDAGF